MSSAWSFIVLASLLLHSAAGENNFLAKKAAATTGRTAALSEEGYAEVASKKSDGEMTTFIRRVLFAAGLNVTNDDKLRGVVPWYSGTTAVQSLARMRGEMSSKPWVQPMHQTSSYALQDSSSNAGNTSFEGVVPDKIEGLPTRSNYTSKTLVNSSFKNLRWVSEDKMHEQYDAETTKQMIDTGFILTRTNPDIPNRTQYAKNWTGARTLHERYDNATIDKASAEGSVVTRMNPDIPTRTQYLMTKSLSSVAQQDAQKERSNGTMKKDVNNSKNLSWVSQNRMLDQYNNVSIRQMVDAGFIKKRSNPDIPNRTQYAKNWTSARTLHEHYDNSTIDGFAERGLIETRRNPDIPNRTQYLLTKAAPVATSWIASKARTSANRVSQQLADKVSKPLVVMKDLLKLRDEGRSQLFKSMANESLVLQDLDGSARILPVLTLAKLVTLYSELDNKTSDELFEMLRAKGAKCKSCTEKQLKERVLATFAWDIKPERDTKAVKSAEKTDNVEEGDASAASSASLCNARCYMGRHASMPWKDNKCSWSSCGGCPECESHASVAIEEKGHGKHGKFKNKNKRHMAVEDDKPAVEDTTQSHPALSEIAVQKASEVVGKARMVASSMLSKLAGFFRGAQGTLAKTAGYAKTEVKDAEAETPETVDSADAVKTTIGNDLTRPTVDKPAKAAGKHKKTKRTNQVEPKEITPPQTAEVSMIKAHALLTSQKKGTGKNKAKPKTKRHDQHKPEDIKVAVNDLKDQQQHAKSVEGPKLNLLAHVPKMKRATENLRTKSSHNDQADAVANDDEAVPTDSKANDTPNIKTQIEKLPEVHSLLDKPSQVLQTLNEKVAALKQQLSETEAENHRVVADKKAEYERELQEQLANSTSIKLTNKRLNDDIKKLVHENAGLKKLALLTEQKGVAKREKLQRLQFNLSMAQEVLENTLLEDPSRNDKLAVLYELDEHDASLIKAESHKSALMAVSGFALLQVAAQPQNEALEFVHHISQKFEDLDLEQEASLAALKKNFDAEFEREAQNQEALTQEHDKMIKIKDDQVQLRERLTAALQHLQRTNDLLEERLQGLQAYALRLSTQGTAATKK